MDLHHAYHLYADGEWKQAWKEHLIALTYGLDNELKTFSVGLVGSEERRQEAKEIVTQSGASVVAEADTGWEQVTLEYVDSFCDSNDGYFLYCHSKGSSHVFDLNTRWRRMMTHDVVVNWIECVQILDTGIDTIGTTWHPASPDFGPRDYWAGNFWWANMRFVRELPPVKYENRFDAEGWIGEHPTPISHHAVRPGINSYLTSTDVFLDFLN